MASLVSIIIPVYNGSDYLKEAIDSALGQTYPNIEIIVVNDGSTDAGATEQVALSYGDRIRYFVKPNGGVSSALNYGILQMRGDYFSWLSHDDVYAEDKVAREMEALSRVLAPAVAFCTIRQINAESAFISEKRDMQLDDGCVLTVNESLQYSIRHTLNGCSMLIPRSAFDACGGFDERLRYCQDVFMWWKILLCGYSLVYSDTVGVYSRVHPLQLTGRGTDIYHHDAALIAREIVPAFAGMSSSEYPLLYLYARGEAIHANDITVKMCFDAARSSGLFSVVQRFQLRRLLFYGKTIRPTVRKLYYHFLKKSDTR